MMRVDSHSVTTDGQGRWLRRGWSTPYALPWLLASLTELRVPRDQVLQDLPGAEEALQQWEAES